MYDLFIFNIFGYSPHSTRHMSVRSCIFDSTCSLGSPMYTVYKHLTTVHIYKIVDIIHYIHHNIHTNSYAVTVTVTAIHNWLTHDSWSVDPAHRVQSIQLCHNPSTMHSGVSPDDHLFSLDLPKRWSLLKSGLKLAQTCGSKATSTQNSSRSVGRSRHKEAFGRRARSKKALISDRLRLKEDKIGMLRVS